MVNQCTVLGCPNETGRKVNLRMHRYPLKNEDLVQEWVKAACRQNWTPANYHVICSDHFLQADYISLASHRLKPNAVPSRCLPTIKICCHGTHAKGEHDHSNPVVHDLNNCSSDIDEFNIRSSSSSNIESNVAAVPESQDSQIEFENIKIEVQDYPNEISNISDLNKIKSNITTSTINLNADDDQIKHIENKDPLKGDSSDDDFDYYCNTLTTKGTQTAPIIKKTNNDKEESNLQKKIRTLQRTLLRREQKIIELSISYLDETFKESKTTLPYLTNESKDDVADAIKDYLFEDRKRFPLRNYELSLDWLNAIKKENWIPSRTSKVCIEHFKQSDLEVSSVSDKIKLKNNAVPSCNLPLSPQCVSKCNYHVSLPPSEHFCCVWGCTINSVKQPKNIFHLLPINHQLTICDCIGLSKPIDPIEFLSKSLEICDQHFKQNAMLLYINTEISSDDIPPPISDSAISSNSKDIASTTNDTATVDIESPDDDIILNEDDLLHFDFSLNSKQKIIPPKNKDKTITLSQSVEESPSILRDCLTKNEEKTKSDEFYDIDNICRICLHNGNLFQIYGNTYETISIKDMVGSCINLNDPVEKSFPQKICTNCLNTLKSVSTFLNQCKSSTNILNNFVQQQKDNALKSLIYDHNYDKYPNKTRINLQELMENAGIHVFDNLGTDEFETSITSAEEVLKDTIPSEIIHKIKDPTKFKKTPKKVPKKVLETIKEKTNINIGGKQFILAKAFTCKRCKEIYFTEISFNTHVCNKENIIEIDDTNVIPLKVSGSPKMKKCKTCLRILKNQFEQFTHKCFAKSRKNPLRCVKCNVRFSCYSLYINHTCDPEKVKLVEQAKESGHNNIRVYKCKQCDNQYLTLKELNSHKKNDHPFPFVPKTKIPKCHYCSITFNSMDELKQHRKESHGQHRIVTCPTCMKQMTAMSYSSHKQIHSLEKRFCCEYCGSRFNSTTNFRSHVNKVHLGLKPYTCDICNRSYSSKSKMLEHRNVHSDTKKYMCDLCGATFTYRSCLDSHVRKKRCGKTKGLTRNHQCPNCDEKLPSRRLLIQHRREAHGLRKGNTPYNDQKTYTCEVCKIPCDSASDLRSHEGIHGERQFICTQCKRSFFTAERLERHLKVHDTVNVRCEICLKGFYTKLSLKMHMLTHTGEKKYHCTYCPKQFTQQGHLISHTRTHTGAKPYNCPYCKRAFAMSGNLTVHIRTHTGERPYECSFCDQAFFDASSRKRHMVQKHGYENANNFALVDIEMSSNE